MKLLLSVVLFVSTQCVLFGQDVPNYGSIGVAAYSSSKPTSGISIRFANDVLAALKKQTKVKAVGEVRVLTSPPTKLNLIEAFSASKVDTLAVVVTESGSDENAAFSIEVVQRAGDGIAQTIAMVGKVLVQQLDALSQSVANTLVAFASKFKEVHVILHVLTIPSQSEITVGGSDTIRSGLDGIGIFDGTRPVGKTIAQVMKIGYDTEKFDFEVPAAFQGPYVRVDRRVELKAKTIP